MNRSNVKPGIVLALFLGLGTTTAAYAQQGQYPAPPEWADKLALPECGFAATKSWGPNGFQYCDARNVYPRPNWGPAGYGRSR